jgi:16S rRNA (guanine966-N2)-methyltransferase
VTRASGGGRAGRAAARRTGQLRIIGGRLRGRRLPVPEQPGLRPTSDRVRETLFNWLAADLPGSRCLDCFAGAGGLGFEAFSRGASAVLLIERAATVAANLESNAAVLRAAEDGADGRLEILRADVLTWLARAPHRSFDIAFLDPPFADDVIDQACSLLARGWLAPSAAVYLETAVTAAPPRLPPGWSLDRERTTGQVRYALARLPGG